MLYFLCFSPLLLLISCFLLYIQPLLLSPLLFLVLRLLLHSTRGGDAGVMTPSGVGASKGDSRVRTRVGFRESLRAR